MVLKEILSRQNIEITLTYFLCDIATELSPNVHLIWIKRLYTARHNKKTGDKVQDFKDGNELEFVNFILTGCPETKRCHSDGTLGFFQAVMLSLKFICISMFSSLLSDFFSWNCKWFEPTTLTRTIIIYRPVFLASCFMMIKQDYRPISTVFLLSLQI